MDQRPIDSRDLASRVPDEARSLCRRLQRHGHGAWLVGGGVRDLLLGRQVGDWDVATTARPEQVRRIFRRVVPTGLKHGTVTVLWRGAAYEVTTLRAERGYSDGRHPDEIRFVDDIGEDLARRDFTVNAMALDPVSGELVDPFGGLQDLREGLLRAVGDPVARFREDGLRVMRAARFRATLRMRLEPATEAAMRQALDVLAKVSKERIRDELLKTMTAEEPSLGLRVMQRQGVLGVVCPELERQVGCEQNRFHAYDCWRHTLHTVDLHPGPPIERIAALLHDLGKPASRARHPETGDWTFYHHERIGARLADRWLRTYRFSNDERELVVALVRHHLVCYSPEWSDAAVRRFLRRVGPERVEPLLRLARADVRAKGRPVDDELARLEALRARIDRVLAEGAALGPKDLAIDGREVMAALGIPPGPMVGRLLRALLEEVLEDPSLNTPERLRARLPALHARLVASGASGEQAGGRP